MSSYSVAEMRNIISEEYDGNHTWRDKVKNMSDKQVIAVYYRMINESSKPKGKLSTNKKHNTKNTTKRYNKQSMNRHSSYSDIDEDDNYEQLTFDNYFTEGV